MMLAKLAQAALILFTIFSLILALKLRFSNLNLPFWADEYQTVNTAAGLDPVNHKPSLKYAWLVHRSTMMSPPAFNVILHYWLRLGRSTAWTRLLPSLIGFFSLVYVYRLGKETGLKLTAILLGTAVTAVSWVFVHYSEEVAVYSLAILAAFALAFYLVRYINRSSHPDFVRLTAITLFGTLINFGNWVYLALIGVYLVIEAVRKKSFKRIAIFSVLASLLITFLFFDQLRHKTWWGFSAPYLARHKLNSVAFTGIPAKIVKDNLDFFAYVVGATPWYLDATFFPSSDRFGTVFTRQYYISLILVGLIFLSYYLFLSLHYSSDPKELTVKLLPLYLLFSVVTLVNFLSFLGLYPIGAVRMSLFYAPLVIWAMMQFLDLIFKRINLFSLIVIGSALMLIVNGLTRLIRVPQRHIGQITQDRLASLNAGAILSP